MSGTQSAFKTRPHGWTRERLDQLSREDLVNLQENAVRLGEADLATLCEELARERPRRGPAAGAAAQRLKGRPKLVSRATAFGARGVFLQDPRTSWSGIRKADGMVVIGIWSAAVQTRKGTCACLLWAPNVDGARPWSDTAAGRERLEHCKAALERHSGEALLVHGEAFEGRLPEDRARSILGIDVETVIQFDVELRRGEYWAVWGGRSSAAKAAS